MGLAFIAIISIYISLSDSQGDILPSLGIFAIGLQRLLPCLQQCYRGWAAYKGSVFDLMYVLEASSPNNFSPPRYLTTNSISKVFSLKNISFKYTTNSKFIFKDLSIDFVPGNVYGICGRTGMGKSTFLDIIAGLLLPTSGKISVDDVLLHDNHESQKINWSKLISYASQHTFISDQSLHNNITLTRNNSHVDLHKLEYSLSISKVSDFVNSLSDKLETPLGEFGSLLSGGQRQRVGRALVPTTYFNSG